MSKSEPKFTLGIEEEYLLVDCETRALVVEPPQGLMSECEELIGEQVSSELLQSQIEIGTKVCNNIQEAREDLMRLRKAVVDVAANHDLAPIAASTHPFSNWRSRLSASCRSNNKPNHRHKKSRLHNRSSNLLRKPKPSNRLNQRRRAAARPFCFLAVAAHWWPD